MPLTPSWFALACSISVSTWCTACSSASTAPARTPDQDEATPAGLNTDPAYRGDIALICNVDEAIGADRLDPLETQQKREDFLVERVKHPDAIYFLTLFRTKPDRERGEMLAKRASELKLEACPLRDRLRQAGP